MSDPGDLVQRSGVAVREPTRLHDRLDERDLGPHPICCSVEHVQHGDILDRGSDREAELVGNVGLVLPAVEVIDDRFCADAFDGGATEARIRVTADR